jgi:hypothetical protein
VLYPIYKAPWMHWTQWHQNVTTSFAPAPATSALQLINRWTVPTRTSQQCVVVVHTSATPTKCTIMDSPEIVPCKFNRNIWTRVQFLHFFPPFSFLFCCSTVVHHHGSLVDFPTLTIIDVRYGMVRYEHLLYHYVIGGCSSIQLIIVV